MEGQNGAAPEDLDLLRLKSAAYDCLHQVESWRNRLNELNTEIARREQAKAQAAPAKVEPPPAVPAGVEE